MRIAHNLIIDHYRKNSRMPMVKGNSEFDIFDIIPSNDKNKHEQIEAEQIHDRLKKLVKHLPHDQKEVLMMRIYFDMSFKEISEMTNVSINTALGRMRYALINLRKMAEEKNITYSIS